MSSPHEYGVYVARFPFLDSDKGKLRPVIVLSKPYGKHQVVSVAPVSSKPSREAVDAIVSNLGAAGLVKPSVVQLHRLSALLESDLVNKLGVLSKADVQELQLSLRKLLGL